MELQANAIEQFQNSIKEIIFVIYGGNDPTDENFPFRILGNNLLGLKEDFDVLYRFISKYQRDDIIQIVNERNQQNNLLNFFNFQLPIFDNTRLEYEYMMVNGFFTILNFIIEIYRSGDNYDSILPYEPLRVIALGYIKLLQKYANDHAVTVDLVKLVRSETEGRVKEYEVAQKQFFAEFKAAYEAKLKMVNNIIVTAINNFTSHGLSVLDNARFARYSDVSSLSLSEAGCGMWGEDVAGVAGKIVEMYNETSNPNPKLEEIGHLVCGRVNCNFSAQIKDQMKDGGKKVLVLFCCQSHSFKVRNDVNLTILASWYHETTSGVVGAVHLVRNGRTQLY